MPISQIVTNSIANGAITAVDIASGQTFALNGITFPATAVPSANANTLDDYEEGTFTPIVLAGITSPNYVRQTGTYTKIGNLVQFQISLQTGGSGSLNGSNLLIGGLPFVLPSFAGGVGFSYAYVNSGFINSTSTNLPTLYGDELSQNLSFYQTTGAPFVGTNLTSATFRVDITGTYRV